MMTRERLMTVVAGLALTVGGSALMAQDSKPDDKKPAAAQPAKKDDKKTDATAPAKEQLVYVQLQTSMGDILLELNQTKAPISVENFLRYVEKGHYNGTIFHRVMNRFMIQGGGFTPSLEQKETSPAIKNEWQNGLKNERYTVAMARLGGRADSATSQFFINVADNSFLDQPRDGSGYAVFGKVVAGRDVVDKIEAVKTGAKDTPKGQPMTDVPVETVTINAAKKLTDDEATKIKNAGTGGAKPAPTTTKPAETAKPDEKAKPEEKK